MTGTPVLLPRHRLLGDAAADGTDLGREAGPTLRVLTAASTVVAMIVRTPARDERITLWATSHRAVSSRRIGNDVFEVAEIDRHRLATTACRLLGLRSTPPPPAAARRLHRSDLGRWRLGANTVLRRWELSAVRTVDGGVQGRTMEAVTVDGGVYEIAGETWVTALPVAGEDLAARIDRWLGRSSS